VDQPEERAPESVDTTRPNSARIYDYFLGGSHHFAVDREAAEAALAASPELGARMRANRRFLTRAVRYLLAHGIDQFLDLGSGIPTVGNVHEVAQAANPEARVVYVDIEPVAVAHARNLLRGNRNAIVIQADLRDPVKVLGDEQVRRMIDFARPIGVLIVGTMHFIPESDDPAGIIAGYREAMAPGSYLVMTHGTATEDMNQSQFKAVYARTGTPITLRSQSDVEAMFNGFDLVQPGVVRLWQWPEPSGDDHIGGFCGVGLLR
jgi:SAM-dependent methyltransferase